MAASNIDFTTITHVIHFSVIPESNGKIDATTNDLTKSAITNLVGLAHSAGKPALICVGGAGSETGFLGATTPANLGVFTTNVFNFMATNGYDGVDLDWEPFNSADAGQYTNFVVAMRGLLGNKLFTVAAPAYAETGDSPTAEFTMLAAVQNQFNQINIMSYDLSGAYEGWVTWFNSPLYDGGLKFPNSSRVVPSINGAVSNFVNNGVSPAKLGLGMPFYGDVWTDGPGVNQPRQSWPTLTPPTVTAYTYTEIMQSYYQTNLYHWDSVAQAPYLSITNTTTATNDMFIPFDDTNSCQVKVSLARNLRLGGMMVWELTQDYFSTQPVGQRNPLVTAIKQSLTTPVIVGPQLSGTNFGFSFTTLPVGQYRVLWTTNLALGTWNTLTNNVAGTGTNFFISDPASGTGRFYQVQTPP